MINRCILIHIFKVRLFLRQIIDNNSELWSLELSMGLTA